MLFSSRSNSLNQGKKPKPLTFSCKNMGCMFKVSLSFPYRWCPAYHDIYPMLLLQYYLLLKSYLPSRQLLFTISWQRMEIHSTRAKAAAEKVFELGCSNLWFSCHPQRMTWSLLHTSQPLITSLTSFKPTTLFKIQLFHLLEEKKVKNVQLPLCMKIHCQT